MTFPFRLSRRESSALQEERRRQRKGGQRYSLWSSRRWHREVQSAGGLLRSANPDAGDLTHYAIANSSGERVQAGYQDLNLAAAVSGMEDQNLLLHDVEVLTVPRPEVTVSGSVEYEKWNFPILAPEVQSNVTTSLQLTFGPHLWKSACGFAV